MALIVYIGIPSHDGRLDYRFDAAMESVRRHFSTALRVNVTSLLCHNFNQLWAHALNLRSEGITHFLLLHDDVIPMDGPDGASWLKTLTAEMDTHCLDALSVSLPIKNLSGKTSTAIDGDPIRPLTTAETFGVTMVSAEHPGLLINTGCLLVDFRKPWVEDFCFTTKDKIVWAEEGGFSARVDPEDWEMSRWMGRRGVRYGATGKVRAIHVGKAGYQNWRAE